LPDIKYLRTKNSDLGLFWRPFGIENVGIFYVHYTYLMAIGYFLGHYILVLVCCKLKNLASSAEIILVHSMIKFRSLLAYTATAPLNQKLLDAAHLDKISGSRV
jgi:hypothetical protein